MTRGTTRVSWLVAAVAMLLGMSASQASALIEPPATIDGPSRDIVELGGVAVAEDGTGGLVYTRAVDGVPHVFVSRYRGGSWGVPLRVDFDRPYEASTPRIAAGPRGELLVVWVTQMATIGGRVQYGLVSAAVRVGSRGFGPSLVIDPDVEAGLGVDPDLSLTAPGQAAVAYRVVTNDFTLASGFTTAVQLRPGDVMADIRVARLGGVRWSRVGSVNRNPAASMRPPTAANGPRIVATPDGAAVVAWQEPDQTGVARIWARRLFAAVPGPPLQATPSQWDGRQLSEDADALALDVSKFGLAQVVARIAAGVGGSFGGVQLLVNVLPSTLEERGARFIGAETVGAASSAIGAPSVAVADGGARGTARIGWVAGVTPQLATGDETLRAGSVAGPAAATTAADTVVSVNPGGGGLLAWPAVDAAGRAGLAVREDVPGGASQSGLVAGARGGPVSQLSIGRTEAGDGLLAFRQGAEGRLQIVGVSVSAPPAALSLNLPVDWVRPTRANLRWGGTISATGGIAYDVVIDGRTAVRGLKRRSFLPDARLLGSGIRHIQVLATDRRGQQLLSDTGDLRVDARAPDALVRLAPSRAPARGKRARGARRVRRTVVVRVSDPQSGVLAERTSCAFGDRSARTRGQRVCRHTYKRAGRYLIVVRTRDAVGNAATVPLRVRIR